MPTNDQIGNYVEKFYKEVMNGKKGNLFTRVDWLEDQLKRLQVGDITEFITNVITENKEIIQPSITGGIMDPTDATFSGVVISPSGQMIDGILYSFAIVVDGVVITGFGSDGSSTTVVVSSSGIFTRLLSNNLTLLDTQCLVITGYLDVATYAVDLQGDSVIEIL